MTQFMYLESPLRFLHRVVNNVGLLVLYLSIMRLLPLSVITVLTIGGFITPARITMLTLIGSFLLTCLPDPSIKTTEPPQPSTWQGFCQRVSKAYRDSPLSDAYFGITNGLQSLTVISYFRASLSVAQTFRTPLIALFIATLSSAASYCEKKYSDPTTPRIIRSSISFSLNAVTSFGFLYLLNSTHALPIAVLTTCVLSLITLSATVEYWKTRQTLSTNNDADPSPLLSKTIYTPGLPAKITKLTSSMPWSKKINQAAHEFFSHGQPLSNDATI